jgi:hypothetical protein
MQFCQFRELLLRQLALDAQRADTPSEYNSRVGIRRSAIWEM